MLKEWTLIGLGLVNFGFTALVLWTINKNQKENKVMTKSQEQRMQESNAKTAQGLRDIQTGVEAIKSQGTTLQEQLRTLRENNPDLEDEVAGAEATAASIQQVADSLKVPEVPTEDETGETGGDAGSGDVASGGGDAGSGDGSGTS